MQSIGLGSKPSLLAVLLCPGGLPTAAEPQPCSSAVALAATLQVLFEQARVTLMGGNLLQADSAAHPSVQVLRPLLGPNRARKSLPLPFRDFREAMRLLEEDARLLRVPDADRSDCGTHNVLQV